MNAIAIREKTKSVLGDRIDVSYITEELIAADAALGPEAEVKATGGSLFGNNARYGARDIGGVTYQVYYFECAGDAYNPSQACGTSSTWWARMDLWHHTYLGKCNTGREQWRFDQ